MLKKLSYFVALCLVLLDAQKYGHLNLGNLMEQMPEVAIANEKLLAVNDSLSRQDSVMTLTFQNEYATYMEQAQKGTLTRVQMETAETELKKKQAEIMAFEEGATQTIENQKAELLNPILDRVDAAIKAVAAEQGYTMIFDTSTGFMLYVAETEDVMALVKAKLGI